MDGSDTENELFTVQLTEYTQRRLHGLVLADVKESSISSMSTYDAAQ